MWGNPRNVNWIAFVSACWGLLLTSVTFVSIVSSSSSFGPGVDDSITFGLVCQLGIMTLGCIQTIFSAILFVSPSNGKSTWTTIWICTHIIVILGLVLFYSFHTYSIFWQGDLIEEDPSSPALASSSVTLSQNLSPQFTTLDATILFDFLFLTIFFISLLCENPHRGTGNDNVNGGDDESIDEDQRSTRSNSRILHRRQMTMHVPFFIDKNNNESKLPPFSMLNSNANVLPPAAGIDSRRNLPTTPNFVTCNNHI